VTSRTGASALLHRGFRRAMVARGPTSPRWRARCGSPRLRPLRRGRRAITPSPRPYRGNAALRRARGGTFSTRVRRAARDHPEAQPRVRLSWCAVFTAGSRGLVEQRKAFLRRVVEPDRGGIQNVMRDGDVIDWARAWSWSDPSAGAPRGSVALLAGAMRPPLQQTRCRWRRGEGLLPIFFTPRRTRDAARLREVMPRCSASERVLGPRDGGRASGCAADRRWRGP